MDLETEVKLRFLNHEDPRAWLLTDLAKGAIHKPSEPLLYANIMQSIVVFNTTFCTNALKMPDVHGNCKITFKPLTPPLCWKCLKGFKLGLEEA